MFAYIYNQTLNFGKSKKKITKSSCLSKSRKSRKSRKSQESLFLNQENQENQENLMGNAMIQPCFYSHPKNSHVRLVLWEGTTRVLAGRQKLAGEIMFEFPNRMVCHADSFFIGQRIPALDIDDELVFGQTYFILPIDCFACNILSASSIASLVASSNKRTAQFNFKDRPFEYIKSSNGRVMIKVTPEFITKFLMARGCDGGGQNDDVSPNPGFLCSTPELKKQYDMLVGSKEQLWTPKLDTISESNGFRFSPRKFIGFEL